MLEAQPPLGQGSTPQRVAKHAVFAKAGYTVHQRKVSDLEAHFERQKRWTRAATEGAASVGMGEYEYLPFAVNDARKRPHVAQRAYAQRTNPRMFDRVAFAETRDLGAQLQVRERSSGQQHADRARNAAKVGAASAATGLLLGSRKAMARTSLRTLASAAKQGRWKAMLPPRRAFAVAGGLGAAGGAAGGSLRPSPVELRYKGQR